MTLTIGVIGDFQKDNVSHQVMQPALNHSGKGSGINAECVWLPTEELEKNANDLSKFDGFWGATASPYKSLEGALMGIKYARENKIPFLGTCGGCQHAILEFARNVLNFQDAEHAEYNPYGSKLFLSKLVCSLAGQKMEVEITPGSLAAEIYQKTHATEEYFCNFGLARQYESLLENAGFKISGVDTSEQAKHNETDSPGRIFELIEHPFYLSTLFVPQVRSTDNAPHPAISGFLNACHKSLRRRISPASR